MTRNPLDRDAGFAAANKVFRLYIAVLLGIILALGVTLFLLSGARPASAHSFYHYECCHDRDCWPLEPADISETPEGWLLVETGEVIPYDWPKVKDSPDGRYHLLHHDRRPEGHETLPLSAAPQLLNMRP